MCNGCVKSGLEALTPKISRICSIAGTPGLALHVTFHGEIFHEANFGLADVENQKQTNSNTIFPIGALAKSLTASAVGILVDDGKLEWTTLVKDVLPDFQTRSDTVTNNLTVVDLLCHRTGLAKSNFWWQGAEGVLLLEKSQLLPFYQHLEPTGGFRADWAYSNWGYAIVGEIIEAVSGVSYADFLKQRIFRPLGMRNTSCKPVDLRNPALARPYAAMDDGSPKLLAFPAVNSDTIMGPAMGGTSTAADLSKYADALMKSYHYELTGKGGRPSPLRNAVMQLTGHMFTTRSMLEKSYAFGFYRSQLPSTILGMGPNASYVKQMPTLIPSDVSFGPVLAHGGSLAGYSVAMALLPQIHSSVVVCTNSFALGYVSGWATLAAIEALIETPLPSDYVRLATEAAVSSVNEIQRLRMMLQREKPSFPKPHKPLERYIGRYTHPTFPDWFLEIRQRHGLVNRLEVVFMGLDSQAWLMEHYHGDTFLWLAEREEQVRRGRMTTYLVADHFKLVFGSSRGGDIDSLCWAHEANVPLKEQRFTKKS
ncbi:hypothetical protein E4U43_005133 [Claviceps pusilla]|uniref:Beta-lactamase-related domain-containing protein n=1 Tax=Claviceps pusilla TaxID=123648 RepID=A0A9P7SU96_9HYPO|nr:hypothetical protein E4U43_005133 [Claviceps pusilla]